METFSRNIAEFTSLQLSYLHMAKLWRVHFFAWEKLFGRIKFYTMLGFTMVIQNIFTGRLDKFTPGSLPEHFCGKVKQNPHYFKIHGKGPVIQVPGPVLAAIRIHKKGKLP